MILPYIVKVALILGACLAFYKILLRRETFYTMNRWLLILCLAIAFALPLLPVPQQFSLRKTDTAATTIAEQPTIIEKDKPSPDTMGARPDAAKPPVNNPSQEAGSAGFSTGQMMNWLFWMYWFGVAVFAASFLFQVVLLLWRAWRNPVIIDGPYRIVEVKGDKAPCSFGNNIFINPEKYDWDTYNQILMHEKVHVRQRHTMDILLAELVLIFQWFNPFAWIYRREIESNLEFLTDDQLMQRGKVDKQSYQLSLVKVSAPHFPLSLTTNYNQSILKKRITMMNTKRSNLHTAWKYFFLLPLLALLACLLNEPVAMSQSVAKNEKKSHQKGIDSEGYWFAVIKDDKVNIRFSDEKIDDEDFTSGRSFNATTFKLAELGNIPKGSSGTFQISREAGKMEMTGKFEGNTGMGSYKFTADKAYVEYMNAGLSDKLDDDDPIAFFFINIRKDYLQMLKKEGYTDISKDDIIPVAALKIDETYINSIKGAGFKDVTLEKLIPLKALNVDGAYIKEIRSAGYENITADQLVTFKAQGIDKEYITKIKQIKGDGKKGDDDADDIVTFKAMKIDEAFINSFKAVGLSNIPHAQLVSFKAVGVTPEYIKGWQALGFKNIDPEDYVGMKTQNVTPEFLKSFTDMGYKNIQPDDLVAIRALGITPDYIRSFEAAGYKNIDFEQLPALKSLGITPEYIKSFEAIGYKNIEVDELPALKAQSITPEFIKSFEAVGFRNIDLDDIVAVKAVGVTPEYIKDMKAKGFNYNSLNKYVTLKTLN